MNTSSKLESLKPVHELASRRKRYALLAGVAATIAAVALILFVAAFADSRFVLPAFLRWGILIAGIVFAVIAAFAVRRFAGAQSTAAAANAFESAHPDVGQRIRTSVDLEGSPTSSSSEERALRQQLSRETARDLKTRSWKHLVPTGRFAVAALALFAVVGAFFVSLKKSPDLRLGLQRILSPSSDITYTDIAWDSLPSDFDERQPLRLSLAVSRRVTEPRVFLRDAGKSNAEWEEIVLTPLSETGQWDAILTDRRTDLEVYAEAGDARTPVKKLNFHPIPKLIASRTNLTYPEYTGIPEKSLEQGDVKAIEGTEVEWEFTFDHPPLRVEWHQGTAETVNLTRDPETGVYRAKGKLDVSQSKASLTVFAYDGEPLDAWRYQVTGLEDKLPVVKVLEPKEGVKATSITELPVRVRAMDDIGVAEIGIVLEAVGEREWLLEEVVEASDQKRIDSVVNAMLEKVPVTLRDSVRLYAYALDHKARGGPRAVSPLVSIEIVPFKQRWMWGGKMQAPDPALAGALQEALMKLGEVIKQQRKLVSDTFVIKETSRNSTKKVLQPLERKEAILSSRSLEIGQEWSDQGNIPKDDINLLLIAGSQMGEASQHFNKLKTSEAFTSADRALANLIRLRKKVIHMIVQCEGDCESPDPEEIPPSLSELAAEAERLAKEEADVRQQLEGEKFTINILRRQQEVVVADTGELFARLVDHPEVNKGSLILMDEAEKSVRAAEDLVRADEPRNATGQLTDAENRLLDLAQFLRALESDSASEALRELAEKADQNSKDAKEAAEAEAKEEKMAKKEGEKPGEKPGAKPGGKKPGSKPSDSGSPGSGAGESAEEMLADAARETELTDKILKALAEKAAGKGEGEPGDEDGEGEGLAKLREELAAQKLAEKLAGLGEEAGEGTLDEEGRSRANRAGNDLRNLSQKLREAAEGIDASKLAKLAKAREAAKAAEKAIAEKAAGKKPGEGEKPGGGEGEGDKPGEGKGEEMAEKEGEGEGGNAAGDKSQGGVGTPMERFAESLEKSGNKELRRWAPRVKDLALDPSSNVYVNHLKNRIDQLISELPTPAARAAVPTRIPEASRREIEDYFRDLSDDFSDEGWNALAE